MDRSPPKSDAVESSLKTDELNDDIIVFSAKLKLRYNLSLGDAFLLASAKYLDGVALRPRPR